MERIMVRKLNVKFVSDCSKDDCRSIYQCKYGLCDVVGFEGDLYTITGIEITPYLIIYNGCNNDGFELAFTQDEVEQLYE